MIKTPLILASQSPRRKSLLEWAEVPFTIKVVETAESFDPTMDPEKIPIHIADAKATAVRNALLSSNELLDNTILLAADTVVVLENEIINKPPNREVAIRMLQKLSGKVHRVITGVVILSN
ncbi:MAG: Maf family protein, partial [Chitinophagaceae bacterium]|nr:Maf family protein [Chitinophagaceae bacterium]